MEKMTLNDVTDGVSFRDVVCCMKDFKRSGERFEVTLSDQDVTRTGYVKTNLFSYEQMKGFCGRLVAVSGLHEPGLSGAVKESIKIKNIELASSDSGDISDYMPKILKPYQQIYLKQINVYREYVGKQIPAYRHLLDAYFSEENIAKMMSMPATHTRQGSPLGGMLHATLVVTDMAYHMAMRYLYFGNGIYSFRDKTALNWDLLLTGGLMHLAGNFMYFEPEIPHSKRSEGIEQGFNSCRQQYILSLIYKNHIQIDEENLAALLAVMSRLNEQHEGIKKCRQEASFLYSAYNTFLEMDSFDMEVAQLLKNKAESLEDETAIEELFDSYDYSSSLNCYISKAEVMRKANMLGLFKKKKKKGENVNAV